MKLIRITNINKRYITFTTSKYNVDFAIKCVRSSGEVKEIWRLVDNELLDIKNINADDYNSIQLIARTIAIDVKEGLC